VKSNNVYKRSRSHQLLVTIILFMQSFLLAQVSHQIIFDKKYVELPFGIRIENSGNYSAASFDVSGKDVLFSSFNDLKIYHFSSKKNEFNILAERKRRPGKISPQPYLKSFVTLMVTCDACSKL